MCLIITLDCAEAPTAHTQLDSLNMEDKVEEEEKEELRVSTGVQTA